MTVAILVQGSKARKVGRVSTARRSPPTERRVKDRLENWLHDQVCSGDMRLVVAQRQIAGDWVANWEAAGRP